MIKSAAISDVGRKRQTNQDCFLINAESQLYLLADGMGGHEAGAEAAEIAVKTIDGFVRLAGGAAEVTWPFGYNIQTSFEHNVLQTALLLANLKVCRAADEIGTDVGIGSTIVAAWVRENSLFWTHLGDSRLYLLRGGSLRQLSEDDSWVQEQLKLGTIAPEEVESHTLRHVVTRAVGTRERLETVVRAESIESGDLFMLCCDGLSNQVTHSSLERLLGSEQDNLEHICQALIRAANEAGGEDNVTVVLFKPTI